LKLILDVGPAGPNPITHTVLWYSSFVGNFVVSFVMSQNKLGAQNLRMLILQRRVTQRGEKRGIHAV
jgi:hypothetical protein